MRGNGHWREQPGGDEPKIFPKIFSKIFSKTNIPLRDEIFADSCLGDEINLTPP